MIINSLVSFRELYGDTDESFKFVCCIKGVATINFNGSYSPCGPIFFKFDMLGTKDSLETIEIIKRI